MTSAVPLSPSEVRARSAARGRQPREEGLPAGAPSGEPCSTNSPLQRQASMNKSNGLLGGAVDNSPEPLLFHMVGSSETASSESLPSVPRRGTLPLTLEGGCGGEVRRVLPGAPQPAKKATAQRRPPESTGAQAKGPKQKRRFSPDSAPGLAQYFADAMRTVNPGGWNCDIKAMTKFFFDHMKAGKITAHQARAMVDKFAFLYKARRHTRPAWKEFQWMRDELMKQTESEKEPPAEKWAKLRAKYMKTEPEGAAK